jgi:DNA-binding GntR family transcriptional regulator
MTLPTTLPYHMMEQIRELIVDGTYKPGERLGEQELEARFSSSRSPIREALRLLEMQGLVVHLPRRGFRVREMTPREIHDLYELRAELEAMSVRHLRSVGDLSAVVARLKQSNEAMREAIENNDAWSHLNQNIAFHMAILDCSGNLPLKSTLLHLNTIAMPLRHNALRGRVSNNMTLRFHEQITEELEAGQIDAAAQTMHEHVMVSLPTVLRHYKEQLVERTMAD